MTEIQVSVIYTVENIQVVVIGFTFVWTFPVKTIYETDHLKSVHCIGRKTNDSFLFLFLARTSYG